MRSCSGRTRWAHERAEVHRIAHELLGAAVMPKEKADLASVELNGVMVMGLLHVLQDAAEYIASHTLHRVVVAEEKWPLEQPRVPCELEEQ